MGMKRSLFVGLIALACGCVCGQVIAQHASVKNSRQHVKTSAKAKKHPRAIVTVHAGKSKEFHPVIKPFIPAQKAVKTVHAKRASNFHPVIKPFVSESKGRIQSVHAAKKNSKRNISSAHHISKSGKIKKNEVMKSVHVAKHGEKKSIQSVIHHGKATAQLKAKKHEILKHKQIMNAKRSKQHEVVASNHVVESNKMNIVKLEPGREDAVLGSLSNIKAAKINLADNNKNAMSALPLKLAVNNVNVSVDGGDAVTVNGNKMQAESSSNEIAKNDVTIKSAEAQPAKVNAVFAGREKEVKNPEPVRVKSITSAAVGIDANKINPSDAVHSIFMNVTKRKQVTASVNETKPTFVPGKPVVVNPREASNEEDPIEKLIDKRQAAKQPVVKVVTADLSKNEFYILGENEPVPEQLATNPETQMVVFGEDMEEGAKKVMEFKLAALRAARAHAAKELAQKTATAKAIAELEVEEKEAMARLVAAQKAVDDMQKLKQWQKEKNSNINKIAEKATPEYKVSIVRAVVPEEIHNEELAEKSKDKLVPIDEFAESAEKIADELNNKFPDIEKFSSSKVVATQAKETVPQAKMNHARKNVKAITAKQINQAVMSSKTTKINKKDSNDSVDDSQVKNFVVLETGPSMPNTKKVASMHAKTKKVKITKRVMDKKSSHQRVSAAKAKAAKHKVVKSKQDGVNVVSAKKNTAKHVVESQKAPSSKAIKVESVSHEITEASSKAAKPA